MTKVKLCAVGVLFLLKYIEITLASSDCPNKGIVNQNNPLLPIILQQLANNNAQNVLAQKNPLTTNENTIDSKSKQGTPNYSNLLLLQNQRQQPSFDIKTNSILSNKSPENTITSIGNLALAQPSNSGSPLTACKQCHPSQITSNPISTSDALRAIVAKACSCNNADNNPNLIAMQNRNALNNLQARKINVAIPGSIPTQISTRTPNDVSCVQNQPQAIIINQQDLIKLIQAQNNAQTAVYNPVVGAAVADKLGNQNLQQVTNTAVPPGGNQRTVSIILTPQNTAVQQPSPQSQQPSPQSQPPSQQYNSYANQKKSGLKMLLPLLFDLLNEKEGCGCQRNCNCCCGNKFGCPQPFNRGLINDINYGQNDLYSPAYKDSEIVKNNNQLVKSENNTEELQEYSEEAEEDEEYESK